jgi:hypothetical protein
MKLILALAFILIATTANAATSIPVSGDHSGVTDTTAITNACKKGQIPSLNGGVYYVSQITNCRVIRGDGGLPAYFWYEGETDVTTVIGVGGGRGVLTCPAGTACRYTGFTVNPGPGQACVVMDGVHGLQLDSFNCIDPAAQGGDCIDARALSGNYNQLLKVIGGVFIHCGGWGLNASEGAGLNDSFVIGANFSNNQLGNINVGAGFGNVWANNKIEDTYASNGMVFSGPQGTSGDSVIVGNVFDQNGIDMQFTSPDWYGVITGNISCTSPSAQGIMFSIEGSNFIAGGINTACGPTYRALAGFAPFLDFADPDPKYFDATSQTIVGPSVHN